MKYKKYFLILLLFFLSCEEDFYDPALIGYYYVKTDSPVTVSMNESREDGNLYAVTSEIDYTFNVFVVEKLHENCVKINSDVKQNIHVEMRFKTGNVKIDDVRVFDVYDDNFVYCY